MEIQSWSAERVRMCLNAVKMHLMGWLVSSCVVCVSGEKPNPLEVWSIDNGNHKISIFFFFSSVQEDGRFQFSNTIMVQPHRIIMTDMTRGYHVKCVYKSREAAAGTKNVTSKWDQSPEALVNDVVNEDSHSNETDTVDLTATASFDRRSHGRSLGDRDIESNEIPMPACHMKIYSGDHLAEKVKIGDPLNMKIYIDKQNQYGLHVTDCSVSDGLETDGGKQILIQSGWVAHLASAWETIWQLYFSFFVQMPPGRRDNGRIQLLGRQKSSDCSISGAQIPVDWIGLLRLHRHSLFIEGCHVSRGNSMKSVEKMFWTKKDSRNPQK